jgi:hypothetical protein
MADPHSWGGAPAKVTNGVAMMNVLIPLRVFLEMDLDGKHLKQAQALMDKTGRILSFCFVAPYLGRYCVPALCGYGDVALWVSNDRPIDFDPAQLWKQARAGELCCVYVPKSEHGEPVPSMMLFRNKYCTKLNPSYIFSASPPELRPEVWAGGLWNIGTLEV